MGELTLKLHKIYLLASVLFAISGCGEISESNLASVRNVAETMARPLLTGASVTSGHTAPSPGLLLSEKFHTADKAITLARNGAKGVDIIPEITDAALSDRTIVIGIDLLFWDSTLGNIGPSAAALEKLINMCAQKNIPLVIGDIPNLVGFFQFQRRALNEKIHALCVAEKGCGILPVDAINQKLTAQGFIEFNGQRYNRSELLPDGLHLSRVGSEIVSSYLENLIETGSYM